MLIRKGDKATKIPNWLLLVGVLVVDNIAGNICRTIIIAKKEKSRSHS